MTNRNKVHPALHIAPKGLEEDLQIAKLNQMLYGHFFSPDRTDLDVWASSQIRLPHSARSEDFDINISPWLKMPARCITDGETKEMTLVGAVQGAKTTLAEIAIPYWLKNDPSPIMFNADTDPTAHDWSETRLYPLLRKSPATRAQMDLLGRTQTGKTMLKWSPGVFAIFQGAHAKGNLQGKSIRYLINDEPWLYPPGHLAEAYKRVTAYWNRFILNMSTGGELGGELHGRWEVSNIYNFNCRCPFCKDLFYPFWSPPDGFQDDPSIYGGMRWDSSCRDKVTGRWDYNELRRTIFYSCPRCGGKIRDTPQARRFMSSQGDYELVSSGQVEERKAFHYNGIAITWVPFYVMVEEWTKAIMTMRYGDETLLKEFVLKRLAEFWNPDVHRPVVRNVRTKKSLSMKKGMEVKTFRGASVDRQYGHYWLLIRDWHESEGCQLVHYEKVETDEEVASILTKYEVNSKFTLCDVANDQTKGLRLCAKHGWTAVHGSDRKSFQHDEGNGKKVRRIYSPIEFMDPWIGTREAGNDAVGMLYFAKYSTMDRLFTLKNGDVDYDWRVPGDVSDEYFKQLDSWEKYDHVNSRTKEHEMEFRQIRKHDHLLICELYQIILASIMGLIGTERMESVQS